MPFAPRILVLAALAGLLGACGAPDGRTQMVVYRTPT
jgi:hypothetical protein